MYYDIGIVLYTPSLKRDVTEPYEVGDVVPIICHFSSYLDRDIYWMENTIEGLKVGDPITFNLSKNIMYPIKNLEGLGVRAIGLDF